MSEVAEPMGTNPVRSALDGLHRALDDVLALDPALLCSDELRVLTGGLLTARHRADAATLRTVHEIDRRGVAVERGRSSTAAWLRHAHRLHPA